MFHLVKSVDVTPSTMETHRVCTEERLVLPTSIINRASQNPPFLIPDSRLVSSNTVHHSKNSSNYLVIKARALQIFAPEVIVPARIRR